MATNFDDLTIQSDFIFKKVMSRKHICKRLLEIILNIKISSITYPELEKTLNAYNDSRGVRLDVIVADAANTRYNIEMQVNDTRDTVTGESLLPKRTRYYQAMLDVDSLQKGQDFDELQPTYIIFICAFDLFAKGLYTYTFKKQCQEDGALLLPDKTTTVFLNTQGTQGAVTTELRSFCEYVNKNIATSDFTKEMAREIASLKHDKEVRRDFMQFEMRMKDKYNEGMAKGRTQGILETAKRFLAMGLALDDIARGTGLSVEALKKLQGELKLQG